MDHLDKFLDIFLNWQAVLISIGVFVVLGLIRAVGTNKDGKGNVIGGFSQHHIFQRFLPLYPYVISILFCMMPKAPIPEIAGRVLSTKLLFGLYTGWISGFSYQMLRSAFIKAGVPEDKVTP